MVEVVPERGPLNGERGVVMNDCPNLIAFGKGICAKFPQYIERWVVYVSIVGLKERKTKIIGVSSRPFIAGLFLV